jgi:hypothetical protein
MMMSSLRFRLMISVRWNAKSTGSFATAAIESAQDIIAIANFMSNKHPNGSYSSIFHQSYVVSNCPSWPMLVE